jgi:putative ABC transport system substrate-binding protein
LSKLSIERYSADAKPQQAKELAETVTRSDIRLIIAIATPAAQAVARTPSNIPLLYGAVADPVGAGILPSKRSTGIQNAGPDIILKGIKFIQLFFKGVKRIGTIYNPSEQNSLYVQRLMKSFCDSLNIELVQRTVTDATQLSSMTEDLISSVDVIYSANDNTVNKGIATVVSVCNAKKKPFVIGDLSTLPKGAWIAIGLEYRSMGIELGMMAEQILQGKSISDLPPQGPPEAKVWVNMNVLNALGLQVPLSVKVHIDSLVIYK